MVDIQKAQEWIDLIRPWDDIRNVGYTSRRINQKMQVMNTYLDSDKAESTDNLQEPQGSGELQAITHFTHTVLWKNNFWERGQDWFYIRSDWTYILKCSFTYWPVWEYDEVLVHIIRNWDVDTYPQDVILAISFISLSWYQYHTISGREVVNLNKWDILNVGVYLGSTLSLYPMETWTTVDIIKLS